MGVAYAVLTVDGWYEQINERVRSRTIITHFGLKVLDQLLICGIELDANRQHRPNLLGLASVNPFIWYSMYDQLTVLSE
jgi:hypothetical protein